jgi:GTP-binding protein
MFVDQIKIHAKAGDGGRGCVSFRREKFIPKGGPDGGNGGRGGDIIMVADENEDNLARFFYEPIIKAKRGEHGMGKNLYGRAAKSLIVKVPPGTLVFKMSTPPPAPDTSYPARAGTFYNFAKEPMPEEPAPGAEKIQPELELVADLTLPGQEFLLCKGGDGGRGNVSYKSSRNRLPKQYGEGDPGEEGDFFLELRKIADAGLVGYPNAGKSTLLGKISAAHPKVAAYPFTTLHPMIGVIEYTDYARVTVADIPGLIEGAHLNVGLGHDFLRHIVRCKLLIHVLDIAGSEGRNPTEDFGKIREELKLYDPTLAERPWIVVANKMDLDGAEENLRAFKRKHRKAKVIPVSAEGGEGLDDLKACLRELADLAAAGVTAESERR